MKKKHFVFFALLITLLLHGQEYWQDFFFLYDPLSFDSPPYMSMELTEEQANSTGTYTVVLSEQGKMEEALSYIENDPKYFYSFFYTDQGDPLLRRSFFVDDFLELSPLNELFYYYDQQGLMAVSLFEYSLFDKNIKTRQFTKIRDQGKLIYKDSFQLKKSEELMSNMEEWEEDVLTDLPDYRPILLSSPMD